MIVRWKLRTEGEEMMPRSADSRLWTPEDDEQLKSMVIAGRTPAEIATKLKRTTAAVQARARRFRLSFNRVRAIRRIVEIELRAKK
jgi:hypothetical protein